MEIKRQVDADDMVDPELNGFTLLADVLTKDPEEEESPVLAEARERRAEPYKVL